jgi:hypothetical protein
MCYKSKNNSIVFSKFLYGFGSLLILISLNFYCVAQTADLSQTKDASSQANGLIYGFDRIASTFQFTVNGYYSYQVYLGTLKLFQNYRGAALRASTISFRDDQNFGTEYSIPISDNFTALERNKWIYSTDSRAIGLNKLERLNGEIGGRYDFLPRSFLELTTGIERNNQLGIVSPGLLLSSTGRLNELNISDYLVSVDANGEYLKLNYGRENSDLDCSTSFFRRYDSTNSIGLNVQYKIMKRDFPYSMIDSSGIRTIESRLENRLNAALNINFSLSKEITGNTYLTLNNGNIERFFKNEVKSDSLSSVSRKLNEFQLSFTGSLKYSLETIDQSLGIYFNNRSESNNVLRRFDIDSNALARLQYQENQRDNSTSQTRLFSQTEFRPFRKDTVRLEYSVSLLQYNTPETNNDDRDEFVTIIKSSWSRRFNNSFWGRLTLEGQYNHLVFLKSARSAMNNWNRVIRLSPEFCWELPGFRIEPKFEILANYTTYDYEDLVSYIKSFSFRQIGYRDSIYIALNNDFSLQTNLVFKYSERGTLYWSKFAESPENSNLEQLARTQLIEKISDYLQIGCGARYYRIIQRNLIKELSSVSGNFDQMSIGPEVTSRLYLSNNTYITLQGWYEIQYLNKIKSRTVPNLYLMTVVGL